MNITQRKFTAQRIYTMLSTKLTAIEQEDIAQLSEYLTGIKPSAEVGVYAIIDGRVPVRKSIDFTKMTLANTRLDEIYDFSKLIKQHTKSRSKIITPVVNEHSSYYMPSFNLVDPTSSNNVHQVKLGFQLNIDRARKIQASLNVAVDTIMLGGEEAALSAIAEITAKDF